MLLDPYHRSLKFPVAKVALFGSMDTRKKMQTQPCQREEKPFIGINSFFSTPGNLLGGLICTVSAMVYWAPSGKNIPRINLWNVLRRLKRH